MGIGKPSRVSQRFARAQEWAVIALAVAFPIGKSLSSIALAVGLLAWAARAMLDPSTRTPVRLASPNEATGGIARDSAPRANRKAQRSLPVGLHRRLPPLPKNALTPLIAAWLAVAVCSMWNSMDHAASLRGIEKLLKYAGLYFLILSTVRSRKILREIVVGCCVGLLVIAGDAVWQRLVGSDLLYGKPLSNALGVLRVTATFNHPDDLSIYLVSFCPLALALALGGGARWRGWLWTLTGLTALVLVLSWTRGGLLAFVVEMLALAVWLRRWAPAVVGGLTAGIQVWTMPSAVKAWATTMPSLLHLLTQPERLDYWQAALNMINAHPFIGVGVNTFVHAYPRYRMIKDRFTEIGPYAHNQYLQLAAEIGLIGLAVFLWLLIGVFRVGLRRLAQGGRASFEATVSAGLLAGLTGFLVIGGVESALFYLQGAVAFWLLVGLLMAIPAHDWS